MKLMNKTKGEVIATKVIVRENKLGLMLGLLPYKTKNEYIYDYLKFKKFDKKDTMLFKVTCKGGIHTWFMSFPISVFFLDDQMKVIEKVKLDPFESYKPKKKYSYFLELDSSKIKKINLGDKLELK